MINRNYRTYIIVLLITLVAINIIAYGQINKLEREIENLTVSYNELHKRINEVTDELNLINEGSSWVASIEYHPNIEKSKVDDIYIDIVWSFREIEKEAKVFIEYTEDNQNWIKIESKNIQGPKYTATLNLDPNKTYKYRFLASDNYSYEYTIPYYYYRSKTAFISRKGTSIREGFGIESIEIVLNQKLTYFDFFNVKEAILHIEYADKTIESIPFVDGKLADISDFNETEMILYAKKHFEREVLSIELEVKYIDGSINEGLIWPWNTYNKNAN